MRLALMGLVTAATAWAAYVQPGSAQESFINERFCTQGGFNSGVSDCSFHTWEQCIESARGLGRWCTKNPFWHGPRQELKPQRKNRRPNR